MLTYAKCRQEIDTVTDELARLNMLSEPEDDMAGRKTQLINRLHELNMLMRFYGKAGQEQLSARGGVLRRVGKYVFAALVAVGVCYAGYHAAQEIRSLFAPRTWRYPAP